MNAREKVLKRAVTNRDTGDETSVGSNDHIPSHIVLYFLRASSSSSSLSQRPPMPPPLAHSLENTSSLENKAGNNQRIMCVYTIIHA